MTGKENIRATRQTLPLTQKAGSPADPQRQALAHYYLERMAKFTKLYEYDPVADFFQLGTAQCPITPHAHPEIIALIDHPCRGCLHLTLTYTAGHNPPPDIPPEPAKSTTRFAPSESQDLTPLQKVGSTLPKPLCTACPECRRDGITGQISVHYKETWYRCPLYGVGYVQEALGKVQKQIDDIHRKLSNYSSESSSDQKTNA